MTELETPGAHLWCQRDLEAPEIVRMDHGFATLWTGRGPDKATNEDSALVLPLPRGVVVAIADGMGGHDAGERASRKALEELAAAIGNAEEGQTREAVLQGFEAANRAVLELPGDGGTTLTVVLVEDAIARTFHVGDSTAMIVGQRGKLKLRTLSHSPTDYAVEAGLLAEAEAMVHHERHLILNAVGSEQMRIDMGPELPLFLRDTVLLASDGLTDNLSTSAVVERVRKGPLAAAVAALRDEARARMAGPGDGGPSKPDDLTILAYRRRS